MDSIPDVSPPRQCFVIFDTVSRAMIGQIIIERHPAPAARLFNQLCGDKGSMLHMHPRDYELRYVGCIAEDGTLLADDVRVITTGEAWLSLNSETSGA